MHKLRKTAVVTAVLASVALLGAGTAHAGGGKGGGNHSHTQANHVVPPQQQSSRVEAPQQQWSGDHHHRKSHGKSHGRKIDIRQSTSCRTHEANVDVLGNVGILNGLLANAGGGEGDSGVQSTKIGSTAGCNNIIRR